MYQEPVPSDETIDLARRQPNSWIYELDGNFGPDDAVPPESIVGAWQVDHTGRIAGSFIRNQNYSNGGKGLSSSDAVVHFPWGGQ